MGFEKELLWKYKKQLYIIFIKILERKFVPFAGYEMPIQYSEGIIKEHISTRTYAGFFDVSHMGQFFLEGDTVFRESFRKNYSCRLKFT